ncbi:F-box protein At3g54460 isoform X2 [Rhodamnia argentea]|uniref:F-box protein At3g54460 isoform X2 n=1 Tax=Rhodamnia argentea TaxID=178133 RepID=A0A8B8R0Q3_9MYRT|nr:F-box protein At3g54460 isoform X2 [Rhodamnia argentea]
MDDWMGDHKLCGFFCAVLRAEPPPGADPVEALPRNARCFLFGEGDDVGFRTEGGVVLSTIDSKWQGLESSNRECHQLGQCEGNVTGVVSVSGEISTPGSEIANASLENCGSLPDGVGSCEGSERGSSFNINVEAAVDAESTPGGSVKLKAFERETGGSRSRRASRLGLVHGSMSIVRQTHALSNGKCLNVTVQVVRAAVDEHGETRVVVLVDVYLPLAVLSGWQFPRSRSMACALFRHLRCDWGERSALLSNGDYPDSACSHDKSIWNLPDCHVLGCNLHTVISESSKKRLFDLHEIFKSLPSLTKREGFDSSIIQPANNFHGSGIWELPDDVIVGILTVLAPLDLIRVAATCRRLRSLAVSIMPCVKLKLFPHQQAAVEWMLQRERNVESLLHPLYKEFSTEDGFTFSVNSASGEVIIGKAPTIKDFRGGMFCDEPGLGKTITSLSLILKTQGTLSDPPDGEQVIWCKHNGDQRRGYYELRGSCMGGPSPKRAWSMAFDNERSTPPTVWSEAADGVNSCTRSLNCIRKNLMSRYEEQFEERNYCQYSSQMEYAAKGGGSCSSDEKIDGTPLALPLGRKRPADVMMDSPIFTDTWIQCDSCHKWRKVAEKFVAEAGTAWFCSMNADPMYQSCSIAEETWDNSQPITDLRGFCSKGTIVGKKENIHFFKSVLKDHYTLIDSHTRKALHWLANLPQDKLSQMETTGLRSPCTVSVQYASGYHQIFQSFGLLRRIEKNVCRWHYPKSLKHLEFDVHALKTALSEPLNSVRLYLSRATLIVVPRNLVDHWKTQIQKHVTPSQLRVYVLTDRRRISPHTLAWDYDVVITTFNRLSAEWAPHKRSVLKEVHWLRIMLDEGHTLGSSLNLTNKLQMAISLTACSRWILTGTPTPNTPSSQLSHLQIMLKFLHEEAYGQNQKSWETGILRPFEAEMEEGRSRLVEILYRCMISARKKDLLAIPPCIKKVTFLNFTEQHAKSYNELVVTVCRNILMADWNDPSHVESLLNPKQWKFRITTIRNVRLSCCVAGHIKVTDAGHDIQETMDILLQNGLDPLSEEYALLKYHLLQGGDCLRCKEWCRLPIITPCRHLLCLDCVALSSERCTVPGCGYSYEMQTPEARPENPNPKWPVPKDLIELQPSYKQDDWDPDWQSTSSSKVAYLIEKLRRLQGATGSSCQFTSDNFRAVNIQEQATPSISNSSEVSLMQGYQSSSMGDSHRITAEKVIIFSQFLEHIHVIEQQLMLAGISFAGMYSPMHSSNKMKALTKFQHDPSCMALLMDGSAALGLDLSFVTHVFLMEPIWDKSMEEQVISRAHRMGATRPIYVETLAMGGTIEQQMLDFLQDADSCRRFLKEQACKPDHEGLRAHRTLHDFAGSNYLSRLKCIRTKSNL